ncbi:MAG: hypothetical protein JXO22_11470, partial [Phycisphaerae bacterium]|nr:hypothetical protein [Phycisphaerae bacterium]
AREEAQDLEGDLVTVDDEEENDWLVSTFGDESSAGNGYWLGLERNEDAEWVWATGNDVDYINWGGSEPVDSGMYGVMSIGNNGTWLARAGNETRRGIIERDGDNPPDSSDDEDADDDDGEDDDEPDDDALAFRFDHTGNGTGDDDIHQALYTIDGSAKFWINPGDTKTIEVEYEYTYLFQGKETDDGDAYVLEPSTLTLTGTMTWEVTYELDDDEACLTLERVDLDEETGEVYVYLDSDPTTLITYFEIATFNGGDFVPESLSGDTLCDSPYEWTEDWSGTEGTLLVSYQTTIELDEIDIDDVGD